MIRFNNDYNRACVPEILEAMSKSSKESFPGYGEDALCKHTADLLREDMGWEDADVHFFPGATQANFIIHAAALRPIESVIAASTGHIVNHEAGSVENTGHQIITTPFGEDHKGKLAADEVLSIVRNYHDGNCPDHLTEPKMIYISQPTEYGALYSLEELQALKDVCEDYDMMLFVDGARMAYALGSEANDVTLWDLAALCDAFTIGGTKCGALFGEAMVITNDSLKRRFRTYMKQNGAILAKGWLLGLQFAALFQNGTYYRIGTEACQRPCVCVMPLKNAALKCMWIATPTSNSPSSLRPSRMPSKAPLSLNPLVMTMPQTATSSASAPLGPPKTLSSMLF